MKEKLRKYQQSFIVILIIICMGIIVAGGLNYIGKLRQDLQGNAFQSLMTATVQQQQAFDAFIEKDRKQLHDYVDFFTRNSITDPENIRQLLTLPSGENALYLVACLEDGWTCSTSVDGIRQLGEEDLETYRALEGSGIRGPYTGLFSRTPRFGYYETFTFDGGHQGIIIKSYDRSQVLESVSLSFYNNQGFSYVVDQDGNILLRPVGGEDFFENIFDMLVKDSGEQAEVDFFAEELLSRKTGSITLSREAGKFVYTYVPVESVEGWYLVSVAPSETITEETDPILLDFQMALGLLFLVLFICAIFILLVWRAQRDLLAKDRTIAYQEQLFDIFATYLVSNTNDVYMMLDHTTEAMEYISPNVERVFGVKGEELISFLQASDMETDSEAALAYYDKVKALAPGQAAIPRNTERTDPKTGEHRYFLESAYCVDIQGRPKRVCYISDRTQERRTQESLTQALHMAQAASDTKSAFLSNVSHDIRTPMNAIIGFLALMRDEVNNPEMVMEYNKRIDAASQHLLGLINDVLDMNRIESGSTTLNISEMNMAEIVSEINTIIRPQAWARNQGFDIMVSPLRHEHLMGDKLRINQILINLLSNAVKYTPEGGDLYMYVDELPQVMDDYSRIRFTVTDNGLGMSEEYLKVIFDPFTREDTKDTHEIQGTGLGMAITKSLVDMMGGTIHVVSELGKGSTFTVELELRIQEQEDDPKFWTKHRVMRMIVADDEEAVCKNIVQTMARVGVEVDYSTDGETAVRMMRESREAGRPYDLILLDGKMPNLSGLETARLIRKNYSEKVPILLLTAYDWSDIEQEAIEIGINHFMPKPFFMSTFKDAIRRVMGNQKHADASQSDVVRGMRVLVADDIEVNRIILVKILSSLGAVCDTAGNGQEAVDKFLSSEPGQYDLILMDVQMPVLDGYGATRAIRASDHPSAGTLPIIAMTANAFVDDVRDAIESGMDAHIAKPVQIDTLKATIQQVLDAKKEKSE